MPCCQHDTAQIALPSVPALRAQLHCSQCPGMTACELLTCRSSQQSQQHSAWSCRYEGKHIIVEGKKALNAATFNFLNLGNAPQQLVRGQILQGPQQLQNGCATAPTCELPVAWRCLGLMKQQTWAGAHQVAAVNSAQQNPMSCMALASGAAPCVEAAAHEAALPL